MLKHLVHSSHGKLHTFEDFYRSNSKPIKSGLLSSNDLISTSHYSSSSCSSNNNSYTFYNVFSDLKCSTAADVLTEEDETENDDEIVEQESKPVFYLEEDNHHGQTNISSSSSMNWSSSILHRFRHSTNTNLMMKQNPIHENQIKSRKNDFIDSLPSKHQRSPTINHTNHKKYSINDDLSGFSFPPTNDITKKHRSFISLFHYFHSNQNLSTKNIRNISNSIDGLHLENSNSSQYKLHKQKSFSSTSETNSPVNKSSSITFLPKLASLFHRHHLSEHHKYRVGNLKTRLHHRKNSPPLKNTAPKFQCQVSNELIQEIKQSEKQQAHQRHTFNPFQRPVKPVVMKRVHTWHNTFDLRPVDQCLEY